MQKSFATCCCAIPPARLRAALLLRSAHSMCAPAMHLISSTRPDPPCRPLAAMWLPSCSPKTPSGGRCSWKSCSHASRCLGIAAGRLSCTCCWQAAAAQRRHTLWAAGMAACRACWRPWKGERGQLTALGVPLRLRLPCVLLCAWKLLLLAGLGLWHTVAAIARLHAPLAALQGRCGCNESRCGSSAAPSIRNSSGWGGSSRAGCTAGSAWRLTQPTAALSGDWMPGASAGHHAAVANTHLLQAREQTHWRLVT